MAKVLVLNIDNQVVTPALDLIRKLSNPRSTSIPHITIRYIDKLSESNLELYENAKPTYIDLMAPGSFGALCHEDDGSRKTVFIKCSSDELEMLAHKPHYPDSVFHITLYDGTSADYARKLLKTLNKYSWNIRADLSANSEITEISLNNSKKKSYQKPIDYIEDTKNLFLRITGQNLNPDLVESLSDQEKIDIIDMVCICIQNETKGYRKALEHIESAVAMNHAEPSLEDPASWSKFHSEENNKTGLYLTPPELATEITKKVIAIARDRKLEIHFGDPAIGTGVFFSILQHLLAEDEIKSAIGIELNKIRAKNTQERWRHKGLQVFPGDYLHIDNLPHRSLIIANPPYVRYQHIDSKYSKELREKAIFESGMNISGQSGLYIYFILASHAWMQENAISAWLVPSDFMSSNYGSSLREYLSSRVDLEFLHIYSDESPKFENAQVSPCVLIFTNRSPNIHGAVKISYGGSLEDPSTKKLLKIEDLRSMKKWTFGSIFENQPLLEGPFLGELFNVTRGIATGANDFFLMEEKDLIQYKIPRELTKPVIPKVRYIKSDTIDSLPDGTPDVEPRLFLFDTSIAEKELRERFPELNDFLDLADQRGIKERSLVKSRRVWTQQERRQPAPFLVTYMGRGSEGVAPIRFIRTCSKAVATNNYLLLYPKPRLAELLDRDPTRYDSLFELLKDVETNILKLYWRKYGGGLKKIEPKDLMNAQLSECPPWLEEVVEFKLDI